MQTWQPAGTQQKRPTQPEAESNWTLFSIPVTTGSGKFFFYAVDGEVVFPEEISR